MHDCLFEFFVSLYFLDMPYHLKNPSSKFLIRVNFWFLAKISRESISLISNPYRSFKKNSSVMSIY